MTEDKVEKNDEVVLKSTHTEIPSEMAYLLVGVARRSEPNANVEVADVLISITL